MKSKKVFIFAVYFVYLRIVWWKIIRRCLLLRILAGFQLGFTFSLFETLSYDPWIFYDAFIIWVVIEFKCKKKNLCLRVKSNIFGTVVTIFMISGSSQWQKKTEGDMLDGFIWDKVVERYDGHKMEWFCQKRL